MFLIGGPRFSGTTLLTLLLNQGSLVCLDEPDFHDPDQSHRGIALLKNLFPAADFPECPAKALDWHATTQLIRECERALGSKNLGFKTCDYNFVECAPVYKAAGYPVICIVRDIRDALVRDLPSWATEENTNEAFRLVWNSKRLFDLWFRYEELVADPAPVMKRISALLGYSLKALETWDAVSVHPQMFKLDRHTALGAGKLLRERVGIWKDSARSFSRETHETARLMGY